MLAGQVRLFGSRETNTLTRENKMVAEIRFLLSSEGTFKLRFRSVMNSQVLEKQGGVRRATVTILVILMKPYGIQ